MAGLPDRLMAVVQEHWGFRQLRPMQERAIAAVLAKRDSLVVLPTGPMVSSQVVFNTVW